MEAPHRKKIGFKSFDEANVPATVEKQETNSTLPEIAITPAQVELIETIENLTELIVDSQFSTLTDVQKMTLIKQLANASALNSELTTKTNLLLAFAK